MFGGVTGRVRQLDLYRKLPKDLVEPTYTGAMISIISAVVMAVLFITELQVEKSHYQFLQEYLSPSTETEMYIDNNKGDGKLTVNLNITFPRLPCDLVSIDAQDVIGTHMVNVEGILYKQRLLNNEIISEELHENKAHSHDSEEANEDDQNQQLKIDIERARKAFEDEEGCNLAGFIKINKVPGIVAFLFLISNERKFSYFSTPIWICSSKYIEFCWISNNRYFSQNQSFIFWPIGQFECYLNKIQTGCFEPIRWTIKNQKSRIEAHRSNSYFSQNNKVLHQYYISVVPTKYIDLNQNEYFAYQFTANSNEVQTPHLPAVYFRYDMSPVTVKFQQYNETFLHFLIQLCAIIGGVFTIAGILDAIVHKSVVEILRKHQQGKLS